MKILKIIFLVSNLIFQSCGQNKNNETSRNVSAINYNDLDGDFIPNQFDEKPYIADYPRLDLNLSLRSNTTTIKFKMSELSFQQILEYIVYEKAEQNPISINTSSMRSQSIHDIAGPFEVNALSYNKDISNLEFLILFKGNPFFKFKNSLRKLNFEEPTIYEKEFMEIRLEDYQFERFGQFFSYKELTKSIKNATRKIVILTKDDTRTLHISKTLPQEKISKILNLDPFESHYLYNQTKPNHPNVIKHNGRWFKFFNVFDNSTVFVYLSLSDIEKDFRPRVDSEINLGHKKVVFDLTGAISFKINLSGFLNHRIISEKEIEVRTNTHRDVRRQNCYYKKISSKDIKKKIMAKNILEYYNFILDGHQVHKNKLKILNNELIFDDLYNTERLEVVLKKEFNSTSAIGSHISNIKNGAKCGGYPKKSKLNKVSTFINSNISTLLTL